MAFLIEGKKLAEDKGRTKDGIGRIGKVRACSG